MGNPEEYAKSFFWYSKAAEQNYHEAQLKLGLMYWDGQGTDKDLAKATHWLGRAADNGSQLAATYLAGLSQSLSGPGGLWERRSGRNRRLREGV